MSSTVKGSTTIKYVKQGDTLTCSLRSTRPLKQFVAKSNGAVAPDFTNASNQPVIYPAIRSMLKASRIAPVTGSDIWYFEGTQITFDSSNLSLAVGSIAAGTFKREWQNIDGDFSVPTLKILKNIASSSVITSKVIRLDCTVNTGFTASVSQTIELQIEETDGESYIPYIDVNDGGVIDQNTPVLTLNAHLLVGGNSVTTGVTYKWYKMIVAAGVDGWQAVSNATSQTLQISAADIDNKELYKVTMTYSGKTAEATISVEDETDTMVIYPNPIDGAGNAVPEEITSSRQSIVYVPFVCYRGSTTHLSGATFDFALTSSNGTVISSADAATSFTVTKGNCETAGGDVTLIITGTINA